MRHTHIRTGRGVTYSSSSSGKGVWRYLIYKDVEQTSLTSLAYLYTRLSGASRWKTQTTLNATTLSSIFDLHKEELAQKLMTYSLPRDSKEVQRTVSDFLNNMFESDGTYRQSLTQSEDYILQAAMSMLDAQRALVEVFDTKPKIAMVTGPKETDIPKKSLTDTAMDSTTTIIGVGGGAIVGKMLLGGWGAVFGAIAGTAISLYLSLKNSTTNRVQNNQIGQSKAEIIDTPVDPAALLAVIGQICINLDNLIETFRAQIKRVVTKYESQEKPTIEREYRVLLEGIQSLLGYKRGHSPEEEKYLSKLQLRIEDIGELLENYNLDVVDFDGDNENLFEIVTGRDVDGAKMVYPAIVKNGIVVLKGKVFKK